ncbi:hypothetical protein CC78DRAFT_583944 [Lojkania enalia]|uniref:Uncharacterized protein n=1 Tax=Lojkania enalia TaxID=147567 RepID=A0A9P4K1J8_9PLEO|nr:hypothetical protein CC78DRAFT_583944 [Didymosphaeria enalia]
MSSGNSAAGIINPASAEGRGYKSIPFGEKDGYLLYCQEQFATNKIRPQHVWMITRRWQTKLSPAEKQTYILRASQGTSTTAITIVASVAPIAAVAPTPTVATTRATSTIALVSPRVPVSIISPRIRVPQISPTPVPDITAASQASTFPSFPTLAPATPGGAVIGFSSTTTDGARPPVTPPSPGACEYVLSLDEQKTAIVDYEMEMDVQDKPFFRASKWLFMETLHYRNDDPITAICRYVGLDEAGIAYDRMVIKTVEPAVDDKEVSKKAADRVAKIAGAAHIVTQRCYSESDDRSFRVYLDYCPFRTLEYTIEAYEGKERTSDQE